MARTCSSASAVLEFRNVTEWLGWPYLGSGPFDAELSFDEQAAGLTGYHLKGDFGDLQVNSSGHLDRLVKPQNGALDVRINGPDPGAVGELMGQDCCRRRLLGSPCRPAFEQGRMELVSLQLQAGENRLSAQGVLGPGRKCRTARYRPPSTAPDISPGNRPAGVPHWAADATWV